MPEKEKIKENFLIKTENEDFILYLKKDKRAKGLKIKISGNGDIFLIYKRKFFFFKRVIRKFIKGNLKWIFENREKILKSKIKKENISFSQKEFLNKKKRI